MMDVDHINHLADSGRIRK